MREFFDAIPKGRNIMRGLFIEGVTSVYRKAEEAGRETKLKRLADPAFNRLGDTLGLLVGMFRGVICDGFEISIFVEPNLEPNHLGGEKDIAPKENHTSSNVR